MAGGVKAFEQHLTAELDSGRLASGARLPTERSWCEQFDISRGTVRRVLAKLSERGLITQVKGSGTFVSMASPHGPAIEKLYTSPAELMEARLLIEPLMPALIVRNANAHDFQLMQECLLHSERAETVDEFERWDGELHRSFALATHNSLFLHILELTNRVREEGEWGRLKMQSLTPERQQQYVRQHRAIYEALLNRDMEQSKALMIVHLKQIQQNLFGA
ncbi:FadR/GntR family transcriptional regulator [Paralcaligenes ureilyticus]|uniref:GntR family transcriptional regulator n=1 Tax=Paralcaligenes ureilyticus TaxID=627131 RepID=A0A4R3LUB8_9BURK|nr:FCD domain-containing protein [Paralcaligenes ureilyticus]TCT04094.1 GntR family transcriptional regulator [Paralcaligenes ureilyticus]